MRACLFASATAAMLGWRLPARRDNQSSEDEVALRLWCRSTEQAPWISSVRR